jgi:transcriptional regulator with XRE-family HTH domain
MSQGDVARLLGWSLSKVQRIEGGEVGVSPTDLHALLDVYGVTDDELVRQLTNDARASRRQRYVTAPDHRTHLTPGLLELMQFEKQAASIRAYQPVFYPGVLQTPTVAEAFLAYWHDSLSEEARRVRYDVRMSRRRQVIERPGAPEYYLILDESVIKRRIIDSKVTADQLEVVAALSLEPNVHIRIVPFAKSAYLPALGAFQILSVSNERNDDVLYREAFLRDEMTHDPDEVSFHRAAFEDIWKQSLSEEATHRKVIAEATWLRSLLDQDEIV